MKLNNRHTLRWILENAQGNKAKIAALVIIQMILGVSSVAYALFLRQLIDSAANQQVSGFFTAAAASIVLILSQLLLRALGRTIHESASASVENRMKARIFGQLMRKEYASVIRVHSGEWMNRVTSDTSIVAGHMVNLMPNVAGTAMRLLGAVGAMIALEPKFVAILVPSGCLIMVVTFFFRRALKDLHKEAQESRGWVRIFLQENIENLMIVRLFGAEKQTARQADERMAQHKAVRMKRNRFSNLCNSGLSLVFSGAYLTGAIYCAYQLMNRAMTYGTLTAVLQLINQIQSPFASLSGVMPQYYAMTASAERLMEVEDYADEEQLDDLKKDFHRIDVQDVSFEYHDDRTTSVLAHMSLSIGKGEFVVFTGESGCGKSTMMRLLMALYPPDSGTMTVDGQPLTAQWRGLFAYVPQGNMLMSGTIREIMAFGDEKAMQNDAALMEALHLACADFVSELDAGLDTRLGEHGLGLSEGQMQRIAVARALFSERPILLLDESTSALDAETELALLHNLRSLTDRTVVIISHRPAALRMCDRIVHFGKDGEING